MICPSFPAVISCFLHVGNLVAVLFHAINPAFATRRIAPGIHLVSAGGSASAAR
jgi:hypothetical protein